MEYLSTLGNVGTSRVKAFRARLAGPRIARLDRRLTKRVSELDRRLARLDKRFESRVRKAVEKELRVTERKQPEWTYEGDGMATAHLSPFLEDPTFSALYEEMAAEWFQGQRIEARWRLWLLTRFARHCQGLEGSFAEFGTYRGGVAFMVLALTEVDRFYLFDTFEGIPSKRLTEHEVERGMAGHLSDTSTEYVERRLSRWDGRFELCPGDVFEVLRETETGPLSFVHMDLNASAPTRFALEYAYPRLVPGGTIVFDDYGWLKYRDQRHVIEEFFSEEPEEVIALPTGQGLVVKREGSPAHQ